MLFIEAEIDDFEGLFLFLPQHLDRKEHHIIICVPSREIELESAPIKAICRVLENAELNYKTCKTWTTDGFYRKTKEMVFLQRP